MKNRFRMDQYCSWRTVQHWRSSRTVLSYCTSSKDPFAGMVCTGTTIQMKFDSPGNPALLSVESHHRRLEMILGQDPIPLIFKTESCQSHLLASRWILPY